MSCGLRALGLEERATLRHLSATRIEWVLADYGIMCAGGATSTIYPSNTADECAYIIGDSDTASSSPRTTSRSRSSSRGGGAAGVRHVITFDGRPTPTAG